MSDSPTGDPASLPFQAMDRQQLLHVALRLEKEFAEERIVRLNAEGDRNNAFAMLKARTDQRDAAEAKFIAIRAENDDLLEEAAHNAKQLRAAQIRAQAADPGHYTFGMGVAVGVVLMVVGTGLIHLAEWVLSNS